VTADAMWVDEAEHSIHLMTLRVAEEPTWVDLPVHA